MGHDVIFIVDRGLVKTYLCFIYLYIFFNADVLGDIIGRGLGFLTVRCLRTHFWCSFFRIKIIYLCVGS